MDVRILVSDYINEHFRENDVHFMCPESHDIFFIPENFIHLYN